VLLVEQVLSGGGNDAQLSRYVQIPQAIRLHLSGMAVEREGELVYLSGAADNQSWGPGNALPLGLQPNSRSGFLIGLRRIPSSYRIVGYRRFFSVDDSQDKVEAIGMAYNPAQVQFYLLGTAQDSLLMRPVWPLGRADTIRPSPQNNIPERLWVGRLDWYRISASGSYTACVPDTITSASVMIGVSGRNVDISEVPPGTNPGWLFDWLPLATPWQSTAAPLHIMGPIADDSEGNNYELSSLVAQGQFAPGDYCISGTVVPVLAGRRADIIDTLKLTVTGTTVPAMGRATQTALTYLVAPYAGQMGSGVPTITGPYPRHRLENWKFPIAITPYYLPYLRGKEALLITITSVSVKAVWSIDLMTGLVDNLPLPPNPNIQRYVPDPVRGTYWTIARRTMTNNLYQAPPPWGTGDSLLIQRPTGRVTVRRDAYPMRYDSIWVSSIERAAILPHGDIIFFGFSYPIGFNSISLWRVSLEKDTIYRLTEPNPPAGCSQDGMGSGAKVRAPQTEIAVCGDTIYWIEQVPNPSCINNDTTYLLRRAYPTSAFPGPLSYQVQTIDTIRLRSGPGISLRSYLLYTKLPKPALIFGTSSEVVRYQLSTQTRDTLLRCMSGSSLCCRYGLSDWISGLDGVALLRGGALAVLHDGTVKLAMPIALAGQGDTLLSEGILTGSSIAGGTSVSLLGHSQDTLTFGWPGASGPGMDSTYLQVHTTSCARAKPFFYPFYHLPTFSVNLRGPDTVCVGQVFHTCVQHDTEVVVGTDCRVSLRLFRRATAQQGLVSSLTGGNEIVRWRATQPGYDTIWAAIAAPKWSYLVATSSLAHPIRIRQGHRLRLTTALEGSYNATTFFHRPHTFLTRYNIAAYNQRILGVSSDSLWRLPYVGGDSLMKAWNILPREPSGPCPGADTWYCDTPWTALARVELRESPSGPVVDSAYALIDTAGRLYFYGAPLSSIVFPVGSADTLHFCHCDPTTPKYITVRFPNHLPLHTPQVSLPVRGVGEADNIDLRDPTYLEGIPGEHYTFVPGPGGTLQAAAWAGNCADLHNVFIPGGAHVDSGWINAADYDFVITRNGITYGGFSIADLNSDGSVDALDAVIVITNQNALRQSSRP